MLFIKGVSGYALKVMLISNCKYNTKYIESRNTINKYNNSSNEMRYNEINLQMISKNIYDQIFKHGNTKNFLRNFDLLPIKKAFEDFGIDNEYLSEIPNVDLTIPALQGSNIEEHFHQIATKQLEPYLNIINKLLDPLPSVPKQFILREGWIRYSHSGFETIEYPQENGLILDVEVCMKNGPLPILATGVSKTSWYSWVSKYLIDGISSNFMNKHLSSDVLIPIESSKNDNELQLNKFQQTPKLIVGHNVSFDRIRLKEQYWLNETATKFLDTMALHVCISGTSSYQRSILKSKNSHISTNYLHSIASLNNLADVHKLYCGKELDKTYRNIFVNGDLHQIKEQFNELMVYCASDVVATHNILKHMFPIFIERFPHPATLAGMLELGSSYLPVNYNWKRYLEEAETVSEDFNLESKVCLSKRADQVCRLLITNKYKKDPWMWDEDWSIKDINLKKGYKKIYLEEKKKLKLKKKILDLKAKFEYMSETKNYFPKKLPHMPGYPNWYRKLCEKQKTNLNLFPKAQKISTSMIIAPKLLNLTWQSYPIYYIKEHGWGYLIPYKYEYSNTKVPVIKNFKQSKLNDILSKKSSSNHSYQKLQINPKPDASLDNSCYFFKLPHKNGISYNVGNPLAKDFLNKFSENILAGIDLSASRILEISKMTSYWKNNRDRIMSQLVIWLNNKQINLSIKNNFGAIIPQVVVAGTLTRRAVEPTWMTASNAHNERIGSELKAMISAPSDYSMIGADVDSQELWIASIIGDAYLKNIKIQGATPFSWMTLIGNKSQGTDMHSVTAKAIGISREQAKIINYARIYGAGPKFAKILLKQFNPTLSDEEAVSKSRKMFLMTKGQKLYRLKKDYLSNFENKMYKINETFKISQLCGKSKNEIFEKGKWFGGSESTMFNSLEEIVQQNHPATPFLNARLSRALEKEDDEKSLPTKINWVVQSSAVDFLHLILINMRWLMQDKAKLCLSFHDEVRYLVPSKYKYNAALAMHVTNLLVRCFFVSKLNMKDLPMSVAFFTKVEVDSVLRKEATEDCQTPSNPHGLLEGYGIHHGESLNVWNAIDKSKGCVGMLNTKKK